MRALFGAIVSVCCHMLVTLLQVPELQELLKGKGLDTKVIAKFGACFMMC